MSEDEDADAPGGLRVVSFGAGGFRFAVEAGQVRTQLPAEAAAFAAEALLGLPENGFPALQTRKTLLIKCAAADRPLQVSEPVELCSLELDELHPLPDLVAARCALNGLRALATPDSGLLMLVDLRGIAGDHWQNGEADSSSGP